MKGLWARGHAAFEWVMMLMLSLAPGLALALAASPAMADSPQPWEINLRPPATPVATQLLHLHNLLLWIITGITLFVLALLIYVVVRFRESANPTPSRTTHNTLIEVLWTIVPVLILVVIAVPSFRLLYFSDKTHEAELTIKVTGHQWYWSYQYPDQGNFTYDSYMLQDADLKPGQIRLLDVDNKLVIPTNTNIRILVTSGDVLHSWFVPAFAVQKYATPGRVNETWMRVEQEGQFYGQCNQICGVQHGFMPISIEALPKDKFDAWVKEAQKKFANNDMPNGAPAGDDAKAPVRLAAAH